MNTNLLSIAKSIVLCISLCCITPFMVFAQPQYPVSDIPAILLNRSGAVIRNLESSYVIHDLDNVSYTEHRAVTVLNQNGLDEATLKVFYNKQLQVKSIKANIYNEYGQLINKIPSSAFRDVSATGASDLYTDDRLRYYEPTAVSYPFTVVYDIELKQKQTLFFPRWAPLLSAGVSLQKSKLSICGPDNPGFRYKEHGLNVPALKTVADGKLTCVWTCNDLPAFKDEAFSPPFWNILPYVLIAPVSFHYLDQSGSFTNWKDFGSWVYNSLLKDRLQLPASTQDLVKSMTDTLTGTRAKAKVLYEYMQNKCRYISVQAGIGGFTPVTAAEVDRLSYGDCKGLVNYMQALLKAADIPSYYCIVNSGTFRRQADPHFASINEGDHIILAVPAKSDTLWLECTNKDMPFGFLGDFTDDRTVIACTGEGGKILRTPRYKSAENKQIRKGNFVLNEDGKLSGDMETLFSGCQFDNHISLATLPPAESVKKLLKYYAFPNMEVLKHSFALNKEGLPTATEHLTVVSQGYAARNGGNMYLILNMLNRTKMSLSRSGTRLNDIYVSRGYRDVDEMIYRIPAHMKPEHLPAEISIRTIFGNYTVRISHKDGLLNYYRELEIYEGTFPREKYPQLIEFYDKVQDGDLLKVFLTNEQLTNR